MPTKKEAWICDYCGYAFDDEERAKRHEVDEHEERLEIEPKFFLGDSKFPSNFVVTLNKANFDGSTTIIAEATYEKTAERRLKS